MSPAFDYFHASLRCAWLFFVRLLGGRTASIPAVELSQLDACQGAELQWFAAIQAGTGSNRMPETVGLRALSGNPQTVNPASMSGSWRQTFFSRRSYHSAAHIHSPNTRQTRQFPMLKAVPHAPGVRTRTFRFVSVGADSAAAFRCNTCLGHPSSVRRTVSIWRPASVPTNRP
jgi:hypothetical protein